MAAFLDIDQLKGLLQCSLCLHKFENPKILICGHQFCKECLEDIVVFTGNGAATITCPLRCAKKTVINSGQTVNDLTTSYEFKAILEAVKTENEEQFGAQTPVCSYRENCTNSISVYCCGKIMCHYCCAYHDKTEIEHEKRTMICFSKKENMLKIVCEEHFSSCTHICIVDNKFLCNYCLRRKRVHRNHAKNTIETEVRLLKEVLANECANMEKIRECKKTTEEHVPIMREKLRSLLQARKDDYIEFLKREEAKIKCEFNFKCVYHLQQYPDHENYQEILHKNNEMELAIKQESIIDTINKDRDTMPHLAVLSLNDGFQPQNPLGGISFDIGEKLLLGTLPVSTLRENFQEATVGHNENAKVSPSDSKVLTNAEDDFTGAVCSILNKVTPTNVKRMVTQMMSLNIDTAAKLETLVYMIFEKAVNDPSYSLPSYADMCHH